MDRISWDQSFMLLAHVVSLRSHDLQTKVGCVLINENKRVIGMGYNGFPSGCEDSKLKRVRPFKYPFMVHAEQNAIANMLIKPSEDLTAFVTCYPCLPCAKLLWQVGIRKWYVKKDKYSAHREEQESEVYSFLVENGLEIIEMEVDQDFLNVNEQFLKEIKNEDL